MTRRTVPVEPTPEMLRVDVSPLPLLRLGQGDNTRVQEWRRAIYRAMVAAAPATILESAALDAVANAIEDEIVSAEWMADILAGRAPGTDKDTVADFVRTLARAAITAYVSVEAEADSAPLIDA
jgi:hypothetical protein